MKNINDDKLNTVTRFLVVWWKRQRLSREMHNLDDRMLADIGLSRYEISQVVDRTFPRVTFAAIVTSLIGSVRKYIRNHRAAEELSYLDDRMLADMGIFRSDIASIAEGYYPERDHRDQNAANDDHVRAA